MFQNVIWFRRIICFKVQMFNMVQKFQMVKISIFSKVPYVSKFNIIQSSLCFKGPYFLKFLIIKILLVQSSICFKILYVPKFQKWPIPLTVISRDQNKCFIRVNNAQRLFNCLLQLFELVQGANGFIVVMGMINASSLDKKIKPVFLVR